MARIQAVNPDTATGTAGELLSAVKQKLGMVPNLLSTFANQPAVLKAYLSFSEALAGGAFDGATREAIALTVAGENSCDYCASAHTAIAKSLKVDEAEIEMNLGGNSADPRLAAILSFARAVVEKRGLVSDADFAAARQAGLSDADISEVVANVAHNLFTNYFNHVAETDIDFPVVRTGQQRAA